MKVVLIENINSLGKKGDIKDVSDGYAANFLLPHGLVVLATSENIAKWQAQEKQIQQNTDLRQENYDKIAKTLNKQSLTFAGKVSEKDILFQGISPKDIVTSIKEKFNLDINEKWFVKSEHFKTTGRHSVFLRLPNNKLISFFININPVK
ncbi:50S ribosomal protein L9 [Patescibacteria group bacterium]|nr:50S ribosomal protein L9 [Patescibacteria group bacterium]